MGIGRAGPGLAMAVVLGGASGAAAQTESASAGSSSTRQADRDARIEALEAQVRALAEEVRQLRGERQAATAAAAPPAPVRPPAAAPIVVSRAGGPAGAAQASPDQSPDAPSPASAAAPTGGASITAGRPAIASADGRFSANLHAVMQFDAAQYFQAHAGPPATDLRRGAASTDTAHARDLNDGSNLRRARIGLDGRMFGDFEYDVLFDFGGSGAEDAGHVQELWAQYSGFKPFHLRIGAFTPSFGLEDQNSTNGMPFLERPASVDTARSISASDYREGAELWAATDRWYGALAVTSRLVGTINTTGSGAAQSFDQSLGLVGRAAIIPFRGDDWLTHLGVHGSWAAEIADAGGPDAAAGTARYPVTLQERPELRVDGTRLVSTGAIDASHASAVGVEAAAQYGPLYVQGEHHWMQIERRNSSLGDPDFSGGYVEGSWVLTGERRRYNTSTFAFDAPPVDHPFDLSARTWGAWELALRYSTLDLNHDPGAPGLAIPADGVRGGDQRILAAGVNWYLNPVIRFMVDYQHVRIDRLSPSATTYATPVGAQVGQAYDTLAVRSQLAF